MANIVEYEWIPPDEEREHVFETCPCPFCGEEEAHELQPVSNVGVKEWFAVHCLNCLAVGSHAETWQGAVNFWNQSDPCIGKG